MLSRGEETRLREQVDVTEKRSKGMLGKNKDLSRNQKVVREIHTISGGIAGGEESNSARKTYARSMQGQRCIHYTGPRRQQKQNRWCCPSQKKMFEGVVMTHDYALVVTLTVANHRIHRILVDNGSSADILYWLVFQQMGIDHEMIKPFGSPLVGFGGEVVYPIGIISLSVTAGTMPRLSTVMIDFLVIDQPSAYNAIMGRPALNKLRAMTSTYHLMMKFLTEEGVGVV
jgi:hypothetical protein